MDIHIDQLSLSKTKHIEMLLDVINPLTELLLALWYETTD